MGPEEQGDWGDEEHGEIFPLPDDFVDLYPCLLEMLEDQRLPVVCFIRPGLCYYRSYGVESWSPVMTAEGSVRQDLIVQVIHWTFREGTKNDSGV